MQRLLLDDADVRCDPQWLGTDEADAMFVTLHDRIAWERHRIRLFGREVEAPRCSCWIGDVGAVYTYSRTRFEPRPWPDALRAVRERFRTQCGIDFNGVLANLYRDCSDGMGWHADDEPEIDPRAPIASVSLGASRRFVLRHRRDHARRCAIELGHGSLLWMAGETQRHWQHALPKSTKATGPRINLTFRRITVATSR